jgi:hypothetical protein
MFKKIEIWVLYLIILFSFLFAFGFGVLVRQELVGGTKAGWLSKSALTLAEIPVSLKRIFVNDLEITLDDRFPNIIGFNGTPNSEESYLLLSRYDGDLNEGVVDLVNLRNFEVLHTWNPDTDAFNELVEQTEEFKYLRRDGHNKRQTLGHPKLTRDGGLLYNSSPLRKINNCSDLVFQNMHDFFHHSIETDSDGNIWSPSYLYPQTLPARTVGREIPANQGFLDDAIVKLSPEGKILFEKSVSQIFIDNGLEYLLFSVGDMLFDYDPIHLNDIQPVNFDGEFWQKGDVFLSLRHQSMILLYRPSTNKIMWKGVGPFFHQHDVDILDNHRISVFNNKSKDFVNGDEVDGHNEVSIYDFKTDTYSSYMKDSLIENDVRTITSGRSEVLPKGELFIEEGNFARTLFFNADGSLRWTHVNRAENGNIYAVSWSRILYTPEDIQSVKKVLTNTGACNE